MAGAALVLSDRLDKTSLVLAGQTEKEVRERSHLFRSCRSNMLVILVLHWLSKWFDKEPCEQFYHILTSFSSCQDDDLGIGATGRPFLASV